ncbi:hypothetical protein DMH04_34440 [Kibdelosporangium aridum]|uniref:Calcium-binding protein n=1 Tax=Kibdelosporangium aridum TaxID=2030 RepID=A0A428Z0K0_KIBAR|nr:hypothetical protein DMH04_34440 [Kibdelosporangium aridum]
MKGSWERATLRLGTVAAVIAAQGLLSTSVANAAGGGTVLVDGSELRYTTAPDDNNRVEVTFAGGWYFVHDEVWMNPGQGCTYPNPNDRTRVRCNSTGVTWIKVYGSEGDDRITNSTETRSELHGGTGADKMRGGSGSDYLYGGDGNDNLHGHGGHDVLFAGHGNDILYGHRGNDQLYGGPGDDALSGQAGNDLLAGGEGADTLLGEDDDDTLYGNDGDDDLDGGAGTNKLDGGNGTDKCKNGPTIVNCEP